MPAFIKGMEEHNNEIEQIIQNTEKPSFENVINIDGNKKLIKIVDLFGRETNKISNLLTLLCFFHSQYLIALNQGKLVKFINFILNVK